ncbi:MAG: DUF4395 family protein [Actinomycetota bacterium]
MVDSHLPRFSQGVIAAVLSAAFVADVPVVVPVAGLALTAAVVGGPRYNLFAYVYRALPIPAGDLEPAAPPRFSQALGATFLAISTVGLYAARADTAPWWVLGWGPTLAVAVLAAIAAATAF